MAKNRKNDWSAVRLGTALWVMLCCGALAGAALGYVWMKKQVFQLSGQMGQREAKLLELRLLKERLNRQLVELVSPTAIDRRAREMNLGLIQPLPSQKWVLVENFESRERVSTPVALAKESGSRAE